MINKLTTHNCYNNLRLFKYQPQYYNYSKDEIRKMVKYLFDNQKEAGLYIKKIMKKDMVEKEIVVENLKRNFNKDRNGILYKFFLQHCFPYKQGNELLKDKNWREIFDLLLSLKYKKSEYKFNRIFDYDSRPYRLFQICAYSKNKIVNEKIKKIVFDKYNNYFLNYCIGHPVDGHEEFIKMYVVFDGVINNKWKKYLYEIFLEKKRTDLIDMIINNNVNINNDLIDKLISIKVANKLLIK